MKRWNALKLLLSFVFLFLLSFSLSALDTSNSSIAGLPSAIVNGSVNVITGEFVDSEIDLVVVGPEPVVLQRSWCNGEPDFTDLHCGWSLSHPQSLFIEKNKHFISLYCREGGGGVLNYHSAHADSVKDLIAQKNIPLALQRHAFLTNCGWGPLSARYNPLNNKVAIERGHCYMTSSDHVIRKFRLRNWPSQNEPRAGIRGQLLSEERPNGSLMNYSYSYKGCEDEDHEFLQMIQSTHADSGKVYGSLKFSFEHGHSRSTRYMYADSSDGRRATYKFQRFKPKDFRPKPEPDRPKEGHQGISMLERERDRHLPPDDRPDPDPGPPRDDVPEFYYLTKVESPERPNITYEYEQKAKSFLYQIKGKYWPQHRYLKVDYYKEGKNELAGPHFVDVHEHSPILNRVKQLIAPVGADGSPIPTHRFFYQVPSEQVGQGSTTVVDLHHHVTKYIYNNSRQLEAIKKFRGSYPKKLKLHSQEVFIWGNGAGPISKYLKGKYLKGESRKVMWARYFNYDNRGNVVRERLVGDLTGNALPITLTDKGFPESDDAESFYHYYTYGAKPFHLLRNENDDSGKFVRYGYVEGTNWLKSKLFSSSEGRYKREFFDYDKFGCVSERIVDNGSSNESDDLLGVTERLVTKITNQTKGSAIGIPVWEEDFYLDTQTGDLIPLQSRHNSKISAKGEILKQECYDATGAFHSSICRRYDDHGNKIFERNPLGDTLEWRYDANDNLTYEQGPDKTWYLTHTYDRANRRICSRWETADETRAIWMTYNGLSQCTSKCDHLNQLTQYFYDDVGDCIKERGPLLFDHKGEWRSPVIHRTYDAAKNVTSVTEPLGYVTRKTYTSRGQISGVFYPDGTTESFRYRLDGLLDFSQSRNGMLTFYSYDGQGRVISKKLVDREGNELGEEKSIYDQTHLLVAIDPEGAETAYAYDGAGRLLTETRGNHTKRYAYDPMGRVASLTEEFGEALQDRLVHRYQYDLLNREKEVVLENHLGDVLKRTQYAYDAAGNKTEVLQDLKDGRVAVTRIRYNSFNELIEQTDAEGNTTHIERRYTKRDKHRQRILEVIKTDPSGNQTIEAYNSLGKISEITALDAFGLVVAKRQCQYNVAGELRRLIDYAIVSPDQDEAKALESAKKVVTEWTYNNMHQLIKLVEAVGTPEQKTTQTFYDEYGQRSRVVKPDGVELLFAYDGKGRVIRHWSSDGSIDNHFNYDRCDRLTRVFDAVKNLTTEREFDLLGNLVQESLANGLTLRYQYDALSRPIHITLPDNSQVECVYQGLDLTEIRRLDAEGAVRYLHRYLSKDGLGNITQEELIAELGHATYRYDQLGRVREIEAPHWQQQVPDEGGFDAAGNLLKTSWQDSIGNTTTAYRYDALQQLTSEEGGCNHTYLYDSLNNRLSKDGKQYLYNALNQLLSDGESTYRYDLNGGLVSRTDASQGETLYRYDALDRLIAVITAEKETHYLYDALNRRIQKKVANRQGETLSVENYLFQGEDEVGVVDEQQRLKNYRTLGLPHGSQVGRAVAFELEDRIFVPLYNHLGSVVSLVDSVTKQVAEVYRYSAFGEERILKPDGSELSDSAVGNPWRYASKRSDRESGFIFFGRRAYDPKIGRWVSTDPKGYDAGPNLYAYVGNSPMNRFDPYGLDWEGEGDSYSEYSSYENYDNYWINPDGSAQNTSSNQDTHFHGWEEDRRWYEKPILEQITSFIGGVFTFIGDQLIPVPGVRDVFSFAGHILKGNSPYSYRPDYRREHSSWQMYDHGEAFLAKKQFTGFINGMCNDWNSCYENYKDILDDFGGSGLMVHNASHGFMGDLFEVFMQILGVETNSVKAAVQGINVMFEQMHSLGRGHETLYLYAHSQGGLVLYRALQYINPELKKQISVATFGSAKMIFQHNTGVKEARNYISIRDPVPFIADPLGVIYGHATKQATILQSNGPIFRDHPFLGDTYRNARRRDSGLI